MPLRIGALPMIPMNGAMGMRARRPVSEPTNVANPEDWPFSKWNSCTYAAPSLNGWSAGMAAGTRPGAGSLSWDASIQGANWARLSGRSDPKRPRAGLTVVYPKSTKGLTSRTSTSRMSPGSAPSMWTGPVIGWMRPRSIVIEPSEVRVCAWSPMSRASRQSSWISSPGRTLTAGSRSRFHRLCMTCPNPSRTRSPRGAATRSGVPEPAMSTVPRPPLSARVVKLGGRCRSDSGLHVKLVAGGAGVCVAHGLLLRWVSAVGSTMPSRRPGSRQGKSLACVARS